MLFWISFCISGLIFIHYSVSKKLEIVELADIEKEYMLVDARLRLIDKESELSFTPGIVTHLILLQSVMISYHYLLDFLVFNSGVNCS